MTKKAKAEHETAACIVDPEKRRDWPDPSPEMLNDPFFKAIWQVVKSWDVSVPGAYVGYCGATGNHVRAILDGISAEIAAAKATAARH